MVVDNKTTDSAIRSRKPLAFGIIIAVLVVIIASLLHMLFGKNETVSGEALSPISIIETFEISALDYRYRDLIFEKNTEERHFLFINLDPAVKTYAVQFDGEIKIGIDGEDIVAREGGSGENKTLTVTIPKAYIISHEAPLSDTVNVIFDESEHTEKYSLGEYADSLNTRKKEIEVEVEASGLLQQAQESAQTQLDAFLRAIPEINENYSITFILE